MAWRRASIQAGPQAGRACYGRTIPQIRRIGTRACLTLALLAAYPAFGWSVLSTTVTVRGPRVVSAGQPVQLQASGYAGRGARTLVVRLDNQRCAATERVEDRRPRLPPPGEYRVNGSFVVYLTVKRSVPGTHFACAYLTRRRTGFTVAHASWRYVTRRR